MTPLLDAIAYMEVHPGYIDNLATFAGDFRSQTFEAISEFRVSNSGIFVEQSATRDGTCTHLDKTKSFAAV